MESLKEGSDEFKSFAYALIEIGKSMELENKNEKAEKFYK